jgi:7-carboxy-7-deazaguanine synthase
MSDEQRLRINEIFYSVQGEGTRTGVRCAFVRLTGCHLRCAHCDTQYAFDEGDWMTLDEVLERLRAYECPTVEVTGGEPLLQPGVYPLLRRLLDEFATVLLETSGTLSIAEVDPRVVRIVDLKCPSSGYVGQNEWGNLELLTPTDEVKFVVATRADYEWARDVVGRYDLPSRCPVFLTPMTGRPGVDLSTPPTGGLEAATLAAWLLEDRLEVRLGLQLHKIVWPGVTRGV